MRTTVELAPDTARAVEALRRELGLGVSEAVNELLRRGLVPRPSAEPFVQRTQQLGLRVDASDVAGAIEQLDGPRFR